MIEFGYDQEHSMRELLTKAVGEGLYSEFELYRDYGGNIRMCVVKK
jgi:methylase of polypeptide subunit release factors